MVTYSPLFKVAIIYLGISVILYAGGVRLTDTLSQFNLLVSNSSSGDFTSSGQQYTMSGNVSSIQPNISTPNNAVGGGLGLIEVLIAVGNGISFLVNVAFAIPALFFSLFSAVPAIQLFIGVPLGIIAIIAVVFFVRSG